MSVYLKLTLQKSQLIGKNVKFKGNCFRGIKRFLSGNVSPKKSSEGTYSLYENFVPFQELLSRRRAEARKSIIVQVKGAASFKELYTHCNSFGSVKRMFHYTIPIEHMHFILVEFEREENVLSALTSATFVNDSSICPVKSQFVWFRANYTNQCETKAGNASLITQNGTMQISQENLKKRLQDCKNVSDQLQVFYDTSKLIDLESRLRFLTARQVETSLSGMFPDVQALPIGSSVNGFGKRGCSLDMVLSLTDKKEDLDSRLTFQCKKSSGLDRNLETFGNMIQLFLPGSRVKDILLSRVPIIKYYHQYTDVQCDLSLSNMTAVHMSDFLYIMGSIDSRVRPLVFAVQQWAHEIGLTNSSSGRSITNFHLTLLVLSFLQRPLNAPVVLPSFSTLVKFAESADACITEEGVKCTFLHDIRKLNFESGNKKTLGDLLGEFFEYYSKFNFKQKSVCLNEALALTKSEHHPLYIVNPLERRINVSKNVSFEELEKFKTEVKNAIYYLQSSDYSKSANWGLLSLLRPRNKNNRTS